MRRQSVSSTRTTCNTHLQIERQRVADPVLIIEVGAEEQFENIARSCPHLYNAVVTESAYPDTDIHSIPHQVAQVTLAAIRLSRAGG